MGSVEKIRTACRNCHGGCGVIAHVKDGKVIKVEGDPASKSITLEWDVPATLEKIKDTLKEINYPAAD